MNRRDLLEQLMRLRTVIVEERRAAKAMAVNDMLDLTEKKEALLRQVQQAAEEAGELSPEEKRAAEAVYSENLRNAYFFWVALKWVRQSVDFMGDQICAESYEPTGTRIKARYSGALFSGRV
ncbi:MAG: hypothetical protein ACLFNW_06825 [Desulfobacterales bacterium]